jgi:hypothetical protein
MKSSFHSLIPFLPSLLNHSAAISRGSQYFISLSGLRSSLYSLGTDPTENTVSIVIAQQYLGFCLRICCRRKLFTESLPSNERLPCLNHYGFQASCHNMFCYFHILTISLLTRTLGSCIRIPLEAWMSVYSMFMSSSSLHFFF